MPHIEFGIIYFDFIFRSHVTIPFRKCRVDSKFFLVVWKSSCPKVTNVQQDLICQFCYFCCKTVSLFSQTFYSDLNVFPSTNLQEKEHDQPLVGLNNKASWKQVTFPRPHRRSPPEMKWDAPLPEASSAFRWGHCVSGPWIWLLATWGASRMTAECSLDVL